MYSLYFWYGCDIIFVYWQDNIHNGNNCKMNLWVGFKENSFNMKNRCRVKCHRQGSTALLRSMPGNPITSNASIISYGSGCLVWYVRHFPSPKSSLITSVPLSISFATIIWGKQEHYLCSTTVPTWGLPGRAAQHAWPARTGTVR